MPSSARALRKLSEQNARSAALHGLRFWYHGSACQNNLYKVLCISSGHELPILVRTCSVGNPL